MRLILHRATFILNPAKSQLHVDPAKPLVHVELEKPPFPVDPAKSQFHVDPAKPSKIIFLFAVCQNDRHSHVVPVPEGFILNLPGKVTEPFSGRK